MTALSRTPVNYPCGHQPETIIVADLNGDGKPDLATVNFDGTASVLLNTGDGTGSLASHVEYAMGAGPYSLDVADLNHDGVPDLVTTNHSANTASILYGNGNGTFAAHSDMATGGGPFWVALGDFSNDGYGDLAVTNFSDGTVSVLLGSGYFRPVGAALTASFAGKADGIWYFHVRAVDNRGNGGPTATCAVRIDTTPPVTTQSGADGSWHNSAVTVTLSGTDASSGLARSEYNLDGAGWTTGASVTVPAPSNGSKDGTHTILYRSTDNAGNVETAKTCTVKIDASAPSTAATGLQGSAGTGWTRTTPQSVTLSASDALSGMSGGSAATYYRVDSSGTYSTYSGALSIATAGSHKIDYYSVDAAGNVEAVKTGYVNIDTTAPVTTATGLQGSSGTGWTKITPQSVTLSASDGQSGMSGGSAATYYRVDSSGTYSTYSGALSIATAGSHKIDYYSVDAAGNIETAKTGYVNIDQAAPVTTAAGLAADHTSAWHRGSASFTLSSSDAQSGVSTTSYTIDGGSSQPYGGLPVSVSGDASHVITYWSTDAAGNVEGAHDGLPQHRRYGADHHSRRAGCRSHVELAARRRELHAVGRGRDLGPGNHELHARRQPEPALQRSGGACERRRQPRHYLLVDRRGRQRRRHPHRLPQHRRRRAGYDGYESGSRRR